MKQPLPEVTSSIHLAASLVLSVHVPSVMSGAYRAVARRLSSSGPLSHSMVSGPLWMAHSAGQLVILHDVSGFKIDPFLQRGKNSGNVFDVGDYKMLSDKFQVDTGIINSCRAFNSFSLKQPTSFLCSLCISPLYSWSPSSSSLAFFTPKDTMPTSLILRRNFTPLSQGTLSNM